MIVDCKCFSRNVDVQAVEAFAGFLDDVNVELGLLVTTAGFSEAARRRAEHVRGLRLDVVELDELAKWLPRRPTVAHTSGTNTATLTYTDGDGTYTEVVSVAFAQRLLGEMYPDNEPV
jgi:restriction endonuclease Mrr